MTSHYLLSLADRSSPARGITSVCSAHPWVIEAAFLDGLEHGGPVLIEATCNQVNQDGGYTGMTPADFRAFVESIADTVGFARDRIILGGDHLGPNPWKHLPAEEAMDKAQAMIAAYATAGFIKLHLDTSMGCAGEPVALDDEHTAERAARLAAQAEKSATGERPVYIIGTEVPIPGGAMETIEHLAVTTPDAARKTQEVHRRAFAAIGLEEAFERVLGLVVQPGVEFGNDNVIAYDREAASGLSASLNDMPGLVFEAHSTDYQTAEALRALVEDGFAILKVGPGLTFALREALYGLDHIALAMGLLAGAESLRHTMERVMLDKPGNWQKYYPAEPRAAFIQRHFSYSDRIRYYWPEPAARQAVDRLFDVLGEQKLPAPLARQYLVSAAQTRFEDWTAKEAVIDAVRVALRPYRFACCQ